jgi:hypothetical protein
MAVECPRCKAENPDGKRFCGDCGGPLEPALLAINQFIGTSLRDQVKSILNENYKDQKLVDLETTQAIASRFSEWAKLLGFFIGIPVAILLLILAALGIKTYTDFLVQVGKTQQDVTAQLKTAQASATKLKVDGESLAADYDKLRARFSDTSAIAAQVELLSQKVDRIGEKLGFTASSKVSPTIRNQIESAFQKYQEYLKSLGYKGTGGKIEVDIREKMDYGAIAYYEPGKRQLVIDSKYATNAPVFYREYMHHVLYSVGLPQDVSDALWAYSAIESALAWYLPCSFVGNPKSEAASWDLTKKRPFGDIHPNLGSAMVDGTEIWGSAFWQARQTLGQKEADKVLFAAWFKLRPNDVINDRGAAFVRLLLELAPAHASQIREIFTSRGLTI